MKIRGGGRALHQTHYMTSCYSFSSKSQPPSEPLHLPLHLHIAYSISTSISPPAHTLQRPVPLSRQSLQAEPPGLATRAIHSSPKLPSQTNCMLRCNKLPHSRDLAREQRLSIVRIQAPTFIFDISTSSAQPTAMEVGDGPGCNLTSVLVLFRTNSSSSSSCMKRKKKV